MANTIKIIDLYRGPIKITVPSWVHWMATDQSGSLWLYGRKPVIALKHKAWLESKGPSSFAGNIKPPKDYTEELYTWK